MVVDTNLGRPEEPPKPTHPIVVFEGEHEGVFATRHDVWIDEGGPVIGAGEPLTGREVQQLYEDLLQKSRRFKPLELLPPKVVAFRPGEAMVWVRKASVGPMHFNAGGRRLELAIPWPTLLFAVLGGKLYLAALRSDRRPTRSTRLYHAPLMNVWESGNVCLGTAAHPKGVTLDVRAGWEDAVRTLRLPGKEQVATADQLRFWRALAAKNATRFPPEVLVPMGKTLGQALEAWR
jgi:PRTRC genetic system protein B